MRHVNKPQVVVNQSSLGKWMNGYPYTAVMIAASQLISRGRKSLTMWHGHPHRCGSFGRGEGLAGDAAGKICRSADGHLHAAAKKLT
jgi:hypothetical protein